MEPEKRLKLPISKIITLPQPRTVFIGVEELAIEIEKSGLINIPMVVRLTHNEFANHLKIVNVAHHRRFKAENFRKQIFGRHYHLLICGERRLHACNLLVAQKRRPQYLQEHFDGSPSLLVLMREHLKTTEIIEAQLSENRYSQPDVYDEASFIARNYRAMHLGEDGDLTFKKFGSLVGKNSGIVSRAILIEALPQKFKNILRQSYPIGIAHQIGRLYHAGESDLMGWLVKAGGIDVAIKPVAEFEKMVSEFMKPLKIKPELDLKLIFEEIQDITTRKASYRQRVGAQYSLALNQAIGYFRRLNSLFDKKLLGFEDSPFSLQGPLLNTQKIIEEILKWVQHLLKVEKTTHFKKLAQQAGLRPLRDIEKDIKYFESLIQRQKKTRS